MLGQSSVISVSKEAQYLFYEAKAAHRVKSLCAYLTDDVAKVHNLFVPYPGQEVSMMTIDKGQAIASATQVKPTVPCLYPWDRGHAVAEMQELLCAHGYTIKVDGDFGWMTEVAVKSYQKRQGLRMDGIVDSHTWVALKKTVQPGTRPLRWGHTGADVYTLQKLFKVLNYNLQADGLFGDETQAVAIAFQQCHNLKPNGVICLRAWKALEAATASAISESNPVTTKANRFWHQLPVLGRQNVTLR